jgi:hypothetical protein
MKKFSAISDYIREDRISIVFEKSNWQGQKTILNGKRGHTECSKICIGY